MNFSYLFLPFVPLELRLVNKKIANQTCPILPEIKMENIKKSYSSYLFYSIFYMLETVEIPNVQNE